MTDRDPLDEADKQDRFDCDGDRWVWCEECDGFRGLDGHGMHKSGYGWTAAELDEGYGPLTFVPHPANTSPQAARDDLPASGTEGEEMFKCRTCEQEKPAQGSAPGPQALQGPPARNRRGPHQSTRRRMGRGPRRRMRRPLRPLGRMRMRTQPLPAGTRSMIISTDWMQIAFQAWLTKHLDKVDKIEQEHHCRAERDEEDQ